MLNVDYSKPFASLETFLKIVSLTMSGAYTPPILAEDTSKLLNIKLRDIANSVSLLIKSSAITIKEDGFCTSNIFEEELLKNQLILTLEKENIIAKLASAVEFEADSNTNRLNQFKLFPKYSGAIALANYLELLIHHTEGDYYTLSKSGLKLFSKYIQENSYTAYDHGITPEQLANKLELQSIRGDKAEEFILGLEKVRLKNHPHVDAIKRISLTNTSAGFDIQSFESLSSRTIDKFIEVKSYLGQPGFYWSINEIHCAKEKGASYSLTTVDSNKIDDQDYEPSEIKNPYMIFNMEKYLPKNIIGSFDIQPTNFYITPKEK